MEYIDYYKVLGLDKSADQKAIKKAYRKMARQHHPDVNPGDAAAEQKFKEVSEANTVLSDADKRAKYDRYSSQYGKDWEQAEAFEQARQQAGARGGARPGGDPFAQYGGNPFGEGRSYSYSGGQSGDFSDLFQEMFGEQGAFNEYKRGGEGGSRRFSGADVRASLSLPLAEIMEDRKQVVTVGERKIRLTIPAGVADGQTIRIAGQGQEMPGGKRGDLYITFQIQTPPGLERIDDDLYVRVETSVYAALLGGKVDVSAPDGNLRFSLPAGTQNGAKIRLKGKGMPRYKADGRGDLFAVIDITLPQNLSDEEKQHLQRAAQANPNYQA